MLYCQSLRCYCSQYIKLETNPQGKKKMFPLSPTIKVLFMILKPGLDFKDWRLTKLSTWHRANPQYMLVSCKSWKWFQWKIILGKVLKFCLFVFFELTFAWVAFITLGYWPILLGDLEPWELGALCPVCIEAASQVRACKDWGGFWVWVYVSVNVNF